MSKAMDNIRKNRKARLHDLSNWLNQFMSMTNPDVVIVDRSGVEHSIADVYVFDGKIGLSAVPYDATPKGVVKAAHKKKQEEVKP